MSWYLINNLQGLLERRMLSRAQVYPAEVVEDLVTVVTTGISNLRFNLRDFQAYD
jgi:DNA-binding winged helix-turn-helix (wHTH) protein